MHHNSLLLLLNNFDVPNLHTTGFLCRFQHSLSMVRRTRGSDTPPETTCPISPPPRPSSCLGPDTRHTLTSLRCSTLCSTISSSRFMITELLCSDGKQANPVVDHYFCLCTFCLMSFLHKVHYHTNPLTPLWAHGMFCLLG